MIGYAQTSISYQETAARGGTRKTKCPFCKKYTYIQNEKYEYEHKPRNPTSSISTIKPNLLTDCNQATATAQVYSGQSENTPRETPRPRSPQRPLHFDNTGFYTSCPPPSLVFEIVGVCSLPLVPPPIGLEHLALGPAIVVDLSELSLALGWKDWLRLCTRSCSFSARPLLTGDWSLPL